MDMPGWMTSVKQQLTELDRRVRSVGSDLALVSTTNMPFLRAEAYKAQPVLPGSWYNIDFWSPSYTHPDIVMNGGPEGRTTFTVQKPGLYDIRFNAMFRNEISSAGVRGAGIFINAAQVAGYYAPPIAAQGDYANSSCDTLYRLAVGNYINFRVLQNTAGTVNMHTAPFTQCSIRRVGD
jgi:hypothetical protein